MGHYKSHGFTPVFALASVLTACATPPDASPRSSLSHLPAAPLREAPAVPNPRFQGISAVIWYFRNEGLVMCGITQDKGVQKTPDNVTTQYTKLVDGGYGLEVEQNNVKVTVRINGADVKSLEKNGSAEKLDAEQSKMFVDMLQAQRNVCSSLVLATERGPSHELGGLRPGQVIDFKNGDIRQILVVGVPTSTPTP